MKKNSFIEGAIIATLGIIVVKVIGLLYVIPFNAIIGEQGGALYGYAYNIYNLFLAMSSAGFPFAISKLTSEYLAIGDNEAVKDTYKIATNIISIVSILIFVILFIFAPQIGKLILGSSTGGNTYSDIAFVIRMVSFAMLVVPFLSVTKGFLQGHKYIGPTSVSQVIEQIVRVVVILVGSYLALKVFNADLKIAVGIAVSGAFFGGLASYIYLKIKLKKSNLILKESHQNEKKVTSKEISKKIIQYSVPFIIISLIYNLYNTVDMILVSRTMTDILKMPSNVVESVVSVFTTWGVKLNNILLAITTGLTTSLIPNIVSSFTKGNIKDVNNKFNKAIQCVLFIIVPLTLFLSLLVKPVWTVFYGNSVYGPIVYKAFVFSALFGGLYSIVVNTLQGLNKYKLVITTVLIGLLINTVLDVPMMLLVNYLGYEASYGAIFAAIIGYSTSIMLSLTILHRKYGFSFKDTVKRIPNYIISWSLFVITILLLKLCIPTNLAGRLAQIPILIIYGVISFGIYFIISYYNGNLGNIFNIKRKGNNKMKIGIANDHRGYETKLNLTKYLRDKGYNVVDYGTNSSERVDYTKYGFILGEKVASKEVDCGIAICGSAIGISIACNKVKGIRCGKINTPEEAIHGRERDYINVVALSGEMPIEKNIKIVDAFLSAKENHEDIVYQQRIDKIKEYEND